MIIRLVRQKVYPYDYMSDFEKSKEELCSRERFYSYLTGRKIDKEYEHVLNFWNKFEVKTMSLNLFQILTCIYSLRKVQEVEFLLFSIDLAKPTISYKIYVLKPTF